MQGAVVIDAIPFRVSKYEEQQEHNSSIGKEAEAPQQLALVVTWAAGFS